MATGASSDGGEAFRLRCLLAAAAETQACWEEYEALVRAAAEDLPREGGVTLRAELREELQQARGADRGDRGPAPGRRCLRAPRRSHRRPGAGTGQDDEPL